MFIDFKNGGGFPKPEMPGSVSQTLTAPDPAKNESGEDGGLGFPIPQDPFTPQPHPAADDRDSMSTMAMGEEG